MAAAALLVVAFLPNRLIGGNVAAAAGIRRDMAVVSVRLLATEPVFGIGIGQFYDQSAGEMLRLPVGKIYPRQNAHNNFLQILAELGPVGLGCFALVVWLALHGLWSADRQHSETSLPIRALAAALGTFLVSALFGHPLLTPECAYAFWMLAGAAAALAPRPAASRWTRALAVAACALFVVSTRFGRLPQSGTRTSTISATDSRSGSPKRMGSATGSPAARRPSSFQVMPRSFACRCAPPATRRRPWR